MALSRSARITLLLIIDVLFFFVELIVGYAVGSLALIADSFHMLNDVMSLVVALYAIRLTDGNRSSDSRYSYGWHRAEILAALINGVFLLALCFSISLEAIGRFFSEPEISNPKLVVVVGSLGLASNIVGLFLFHEHEHAPAIPKASPPSSSASSISAENAARGDVTPTQKQNVPIRRSRSLSRQYTIPPSPSDSFYGHPAATRAAFVQTAQDMADMASARSPSPTRPHRLSIDVPSSPLVPHQPTPTIPAAPGDVSEPHETTPLLNVDRQADKHEIGHGHDHGHAHGSMNMRALLLHVFGDALGNVGVIATGLVIWQTTWQYKYYFDPFISLVITVIIFSSALPLVRSTSFILLQGVPPTVDLEEVREAILNVEGVHSLHELHVWQLSENKIVASVHVLTSRNHDFMPVAVKIRNLLHNFGIHSCTIQPEYHQPSNSIPDEFIKANGDTLCLIMCPADQSCDPSDACCPPTSVEV
ncbi:cation efflux protein [Gymnopilus junonius]|uniref:Cation efflux protein n=1 Tax=Gymnopilus junonius TaxID=109634 RepID=A0A9P5P2G8_GYMJU|nr:cation efflux protein [Gymnopilus junonius]